MESKGVGGKCAAHQALGAQTQLGGEQKDVALVLLAEQLAALAKDAHDDGGVGGGGGSGAGAAVDQVGHGPTHVLHHSG
jgi:hypothetical protein